MVLLRLSESNSVYNHISDSKNRTTSKRETDLLITSVITDRIRRYEVLLSIIQNYDKFEKETSHQLYIFIERKQHLAWWNVRQQHAYMTSSVHLHKRDLLIIPLTVLLHCPITSMMHTLSY